MALAGDIQALRDRVLADLNAAHDYYADTKTAWDIVHQFIAAGRTISIHNTATGTTTTQLDLAGKSRGYIAEQLAEATFQRFLSTFETFLLDLLRLWLAAHPQSLGGKTVGFQEVLDARDKDAITALVIDKELADVLHGPPAKWFKYLEDRVKLGCPSPDEIQRFTEAKASRDVLEHNRGVANKVYESKAGNLARYTDGQKLDIPEHYHRQTWELVRKLVTDISNAAIAKAP
jgi:hypothetical protein